MFFVPSQKLKLWLSACQKLIQLKIIASEKLELTQTYRSINRLYQVKQRRYGLLLTLTDRGNQYHQHFWVFFLAAVVKKNHSKKITTKTVGRGKAFIGEQFLLYLHVAAYSKPM